VPVALKNVFTHPRSTPVCHDRWQPTHWGIRHLEFFNPKPPVERALSHPRKCRRRAAFAKVERALVRDCIGRRPKPYGALLGRAVLVDVQSLQALIPKPTVKYGWYGQHVTDLLAHIKPLVVLNCFNSASPRSVLDRGLLPCRLRPPLDRRIVVIY
jgi:hypothetical protein